MNLNDPLPQKKQCVDNIDSFVFNLRNTQKETLEYWHQLNVTDRVKWTSLMSVIYPF
jgi:anthranilate/para-aminobenzoate synthase component II